MVTLCWSAKGGSGTSTVAASLALRPDHPALLVDLDGELAAVLGVPEPEGPGVADWMASDAPPAHLADLLVELDPTTQLLPYRLGGRPEDDALDVARLSEVVSWLRRWELEHAGHAVIDAGTGEPAEPLLAVERNLLITRNCYLSVTRAARAVHPPGAVVLIEEPGRSLTVHDIELALGAPVVTRLSWEAAVARAVDAGLLRCRRPRMIDRALRRAAA